MTDKDFGSNRQGDLPTELVARLEVASEGSDELDHAMSMATGILLTGIKENGEWGVKKGRWTQSLDAALALAIRVLPGVRWGVSADDSGDGTYWASVRNPPPHLTSARYKLTREGKSPALALCAAVLAATTAISVGTDGPQSGPVVNQNTQVIP